MILRLLCRYDEEYETPVYWGNVIPPADLQKAPTRIYFESPKPSDSSEPHYWSLFLTSPDQNISDLNANKEILHWALYVLFK